MSTKYKVRNFKPERLTSNPALFSSFDALLLHIDIIPEKLVLAQAIVESGWGQSRFAREGHNYFGIQCYSKGCGIPPAQAANAGFEVKKYESRLYSVEDYIRTLNTNNAYKEFRLMRLEDRKNFQQPDAQELANGLTRYSQQGERYINIIHTILTYYIPENLDQFLNDLISEQDLSLR